MYFEAWLRACGRDVNGYPWLAPRLTNRCTNHEDLQVRGHTEEGTTSTLANNGTLATMPVACPSKAGSALRAAPVPMLPETVQPHDA